MVPLADRYRDEVAPDPGDDPLPSAGRFAVIAQLKHTRPAHTPNPAATSDTSGPAAWCSCTTELLPLSTGDTIVLRVDGEVDLWTLPILQTALDHSLDQHPAHLVVDLTRMAFCSARGLDVLTRSHHTAAEQAIGYAVSGVPPGIDRIWTLCWEGDLPVRYRSITAAVTAIRAHHAHPRNTGC